MPAMCVARPELFAYFAYPVMPFVPVESRLMLPFLPQYAHVQVSWRVDNNLF